MILLYIIWAIVAVCIFFIFLFRGISDTRMMNMAEKIVLCFFLAALWPAELCIIAVMLPFYPIHLLIQKRKAAKKPVQANDVADDEPQGYDYEEFEDWCDGNTEFEN